MTILFDRDVQADVEVATRGALLGPTPAAQRELHAHLAAHGHAPALAARAVLQLATDSGLTGHGGAGFPLYRKLEAVVAARGRAIVVANGAEGEPASTKDRWLLTRRPHLVLDGLQLVARATNATEAYLYVNDRRAGRSVDCRACRAATGRIGRDVGHDRHRASGLHLR